MKNENKRLRHLRNVVGLIFIALLLTGCTPWEKSSYTQNSAHRISQDDMQQFLSSVRTNNSGDAKSHYELGRHFQSRGKYAMALKEFWQAASIDPERAEYYNAIGVCYDSLKEYELAVMSYRWALDLKPDFPEALNNLGYSYYLQGNLELARKELMRAVSLDTGNMRYLNNLSLCYKNAVDKNLLLELATAKNPVTEQTAPTVSPEEKIVIAESSDEIKTEAVVAKNDVSTINSPVVTVKLDQTDETPVSINSSEVTVDLDRIAKAPVAHELEKNTNKVDSTVIAVNASGRAIPQNISTPPLIEISNGNGVYRMATNMGRYFKAKGFNVVRLTNADNFNHDQTSISYGSGCENSADYMAEIMFGSEYDAQHIQNGNTVGKIRLVLGSDVEGLNQLFAGGMPIVVANGNGVNGMAARVSGVLNQKGFKLMRPVNAEHFNYENTCVYYPDGRLDCAEFVAREIPVEATVKYAARNSNTTSIKIVIGKDLYL